MSKSFKPPASQRVRVTDYWRMMYGKPVHVQQYDRQYVSVHVARQLIAHGGQKNGFYAIEGKPWLEVRYLLRWRSPDGRKHSVYVSRKDYTQVSNQLVKRSA